MGIAVAPVSARRPTRGLTLAVSCLVLSWTLAACGGASNGSSSNSPATSPSTASNSGGGGSPAPSGTGATADAATTSAVTTAFVTFFNGKAKQADRAAVLQNADTLLSALQSQSGNSIINQTSAMVTGVTVSGPNTAHVVYTISLSGSPVLPNQQGTAVNVAGSWKVSAGTFCALLVVQGLAPAACSQSSVTALPS